MQCQHGSVLHCSSAPEYQQFCDDSPIEHPQNSSTGSLVITVGNIKIRRTGMFNKRIVT